MKMNLKLFGLLSVFSLLVFVMSCGNDDGGSAPPDTEDPAIMVTSPTDGAYVVAGSTVIPSISFSDDSEISMITITIGNGTTTVLDETIMDIGDASFSYTTGIAIPSDVPLGDHTVTVTVTDASENSSSATLTLSAVPALESGKFTAVITSVPDQVSSYNDPAFYAVGSHQGWDAGAQDAPVTAYTDSEGSTSYYVQIDNTNAVDFKYVRENDWPYVEKDMNGKELDNRSIAAGTEVVWQTIATWRDYNPEVTNGGDGTIISIDGTLQSSSHDITATITSASTTSSAISSASYSVEDADGMEVTSGSLSADGDTYSATIDVTGYALGAYNIIVSATDGNGYSGREDKTLNVVEFPCDDSSEAALAAGLTRIIINVPTTSDDIYATGNFDGDIWGTEDAMYQATKLSDGCYYFDFDFVESQSVQFFRSNADYCDWWRGQATNTPGSDATATYTVPASPDDQTVKLYFGYWREDPDASICL